MIVEGCNSKRHTCRVPLTVVVMVLGVILSGRSALLAAQPNLAAQPSAAAQATSDAQSSAAAKPTPITRVKRRLIPVTINKGQNYTISGVKTRPHQESKSSIIRTLSCCKSPPAGSKWWVRTPARGESRLRSPRARKSLTW